MSPPWDVWGVGMAMGGTVGLIAGYQLRKIIERIRDRRLLKKLNAEPDLLRREEDWRPVPLPQKIPIKRSRRTTPVEHALQPIPVVSPDRDEVIAALVNSGYSKAVAIKATDVCSMVERASGVTMWMLAALRHAQGSK